jgi:DNA-binding IscR family transcriptional regulator
VDAVAGGIPAYACIAHNRGCDRGGGCPVHSAFARAADGMADVLAGVSLEAVGSRAPVALPRGARRG